MNLPCPICYEDHEETRALRCRCGGEVVCAGNGPPRSYSVQRDVVAFVVNCTTCDLVFEVLPVVRRGAD